MKCLNIIVFASDEEIQKYSEVVIEKLSGLSLEEKFLGIWGEILFNGDEVLSVISSTVNWALSSEKQTVFFGCCEKDYDDIISRIDVHRCMINKLQYDELR